MNYNIDDYYSSRFLSGEKLQEKMQELGKKAITAVIERVSEEEIYNKRERKMEKDLVVHFKDFDKGLRLKAERGRALRDLFGKMTSGWVGKKVTLITKERNVGGKIRQMIWFAEAQEPVKQQPEEFSNGDDLPTINADEELVDPNDIPF